MSGPINEVALLMETLINAAIKGSGPINKVEACYTGVLKFQNVQNFRHTGVFMTNPATYCDIAIN